MKPSLKLLPPKPLLITLAINSLVSTKHIAYSNHIQLMYRLGRNYQHNFVLVNPSRMGIDRFRNYASEVALQTKSDYLIFLDDDVLVPELLPGEPMQDHWLTRMLAMDVDIASVDVCIRGYPFDHMLFLWDKTKEGLRPIRKIKEPRGVIDVGAVGCSLTLIKTSLLKKVSTPFFVTGPTTNTEDIYFCIKAQKEVPDVTIKADTRIICPHILWEETISSHNKKAMKRYWEAQFGKPAKAASGDRGEAYLRMVKGVTA